MSAGQPLTLAELDAILEADRRHQERRAQNRFDLQTRAQVICMRADRPTIRSDVSMVGTEDVSVAGAKLLSSHPIPAERFWVRFAGTGQSDAFIERQVRWKGETPASRSSRPSTVLHCCGVQFRGQLSREEFVRVLAGGTAAQ